MGTQHTLLSCDIILNEELGSKDMNSIVHGNDLEKNVYHFTTRVCNATDRAECISGHSTQY